MKIIFFSDVHGELANLQMLFNKVDVQEAQCLVNCGDFFQGYALTNQNKMELMAKLLNDHPAQKISVMGNNDGEDTFSLLTFPTQEISFTKTIENVTITATHGHWGSARSFVPDAHAKWVICVEGHTHMAQLYKDKHHIFLNPGSLSYPRSSLPPTYAILKEKTLSIKALFDDQVFFTEQLS